MHELCILRKYGFSMGDRKKIAVIAAEAFNRYTNRILYGILRQSVQLNYDVCVLMMTFNSESDTSIQLGEENIYNLINPETFSGVILLAGNMVSQTLLNKLENMLSEMKLPVISVERDFAICESIYADDTELFEIMTDHFVQRHHCSDIMCLTGPRDNAPAQSRMLGYKRSLEKNGIPFREENVVYGDFWKNTAKNLVEEFAAGKRKLPQAVVCANDIMAIALCNSLVNAGFNIPDDIMISGYDASSEAAANVPTLTSLYPENADLGARAVCKLHRLMTGEEIGLLNLKMKLIITAQSCGCGEEQGRLVKYREEYHDSIEKYEELYRKSGMAEMLLCTENFEDLLKTAHNYTYMINGLERYMLCLCENWDNMNSENDEHILREGYTENMVAKMFYCNADVYFEEIRFKSKDVLPEEIYKGFPQPQMFFIIPSHFNDRCFGYSVFTFTDVRHAVSSLFTRWSRNINIALEFLRVRNRLTSMNQRTFLSSIRDTLTGIYNRKGFKRFSESIFRKAKTERKKLLVLMADLDMLKYINDNFGHIEGDNAIIVTANVLNSCCQNNEVCARIGGDEYAVIGCFDYTDELINGYVKYINDYFERYNSTSSKPYKVEASLGYFCGVPAEDSELQECLNIADQQMYNNKFERKKCRTL